MPSPDAIASLQKQFPGNVGTTLDRVMLWVARTFTAVLLVLLVFPIVMLGFFFVLELFQYLAFPHSINEKPFTVFNLSLHQQLERPHSLFTLPFVLLIFACARYLHSIYARICLGLISAFWVVGFGTASIALFHVRLFATPVFAVTYLIGVTGFIGFLSLLWISIRPPTNSMNAPTPSPQSC